MKFLRTAVLAVTTALLLASCARTDHAAPENPLLAFVGADTPYLFANLQPLPAEVVDVYLERVGPTLGLAQALLDDIDFEVAAGAEGNEGARLAAAVFEELDGKFNRAGIESLGFSLRSHQAVYGMGVFPVVRLGLGDPDALRAAIARVEAAAGMAFPTETLADTTYWRIAGSGIGLYLAILDQHAALGVFPTAAETEFLPVFLGLQPPAAAADWNRELARIDQAQGFTGHGSGFLDLQRLTEELLDAGSTTSIQLERAGLAQPQLADLDEICKQEYRALAAKAPRMLAGTTELATDAVGIRYLLALDQTLAGELTTLVAEVPVASDSERLLLSAALGIRMGRLHEMLRQKLTARSENPFRCPHLADLNTQAAQLLAQLDRPLPPFVGNLFGFRLEVQDLDLRQPGPENATGMFSLEVDKPQMLTGMAEMFVPGFDGLGLEPGGEPVEVPQELASISMDGLHLYAAMSDRAIGLALGEGQREGLAEFMAAEADNDGTFLSVSYDMGRYLELQQHMQQRYFDPGREGSDADAELEQLQDAVASLQESYRAWLGRTRMDVSFTPAGIEIDTRMTFR